MIAAALFFLAIISGMLGLGVAFAAVSFAALLPHLGTAVWDPALTLLLVAAGVAVSAYEVYRLAA